MLNPNHFSNPFTTLTSAGPVKRSFQPVMRVDQFSMVHAHQVQQGGVEFIHVHAIRLST